VRLERMKIKACCGSVSTAFKIYKPLTKDILPLLVDKGFTEAKHFTKSGMLYAENESLIINGTFGSNIIHLKCKVKECADLINSFEELLANME
jgi:hypothetical protein